MDCEGTLHGNVELDDCGVCGGDNEDKDDCGECFGDNSACVDCEGVPNGGAVIDNCGVCGGDDSSCCWDYLGVENDLWDFILTPKAVGDLIERLEKTYAVVDYIYENIPELEDLPETVTDDEICLLSELNRIFLEGKKFAEYQLTNLDCGLINFCSESGQFLTELQYATGALQV